MSQLERQAVDEVPDRIAGWLGVPVQVERGIPGAGSEFDFVARTPDVAFVFEVKGRDDVATLERAARRLQACTQFDASMVPVLVVPFMGRVARQWAEDRGLAWVDLSGNADLPAPDVSRRGTLLRTISLREGIPL
ncbi:MAG: hypothetical protein GXP55_16665 [Deltaproteobacteria bacterium]|nr:hypothetical protein [Deltaproteobacteria bacterium]